MAFVTPLLTNRINSVIWGTEDGRIGNGSIGYYYFDKGDFRFICTDTNYSYNKGREEYEHNRPNSWGAPDGNEASDSLGEKQLEWLRSLIVSSAKEGKHCIVLSHASFSGKWSSSPDAEVVREIFREANAIRQASVILSLNGHYHNNRQAVVEDVVYLDINTVRAGWWEGQKFYGYAENDINFPQYTFNYTEYDSDGNPSCSFKRPLSTLTMGAQTLFFKQPLSATLTVGVDGSVDMKGTYTEWMYDVAPISSEYDEGILGISDFKK